MKHRTFANARRMMNPLVLLCLVGALVGPGMMGMNGAVALAERANRTPDQLRRAASDIVLATVENVARREELKDSYRYSYYTYTLRVLRVDQGDLDLLETTIEATAWHRGWVGRGDPPTSGSGHRGLPEQGDRVVAHLERNAEGGFAIVEPNGFLAAPTPVAEEVQFQGDGGLTLSGSLLIPVSATAEMPVGAALLLPGSGPTDRDGNQLPQMRSDLLRTIAEALADHGVATLRFDKRATMRYATEWPKEADELGDFFGLDRFVGDAEGAWRAMCAHPRIDGERTVVIGQSEGGLIALKLGANEKNRPLRGLGLLATAGRTLDVVIHEQVERSLNEAGAPPATRKPIMESLNSTIAALRDRGELPESVHPALAALFNVSTTRIMHDYFTADPTGLAAAAPGTVLLLQGDADLQVSHERDLPRLGEALQTRDRGKSTAVVLLRVGHNLKPVERSDELNFSGPVAPTALIVIIAWAQEAVAQ